MGFQFDRAYDTCPLCVPARTALATGLYPTKNAVVYNDWKGITAGEYEPVHAALKKSRVPGRPCRGRSYQDTAAYETAGAGLLCEPGGL